MLDGGGQFHLLQVAVHGQGPVAYATQLLQWREIKVCDATAQQGFVAYRGNGHFAGKFNCAERSARFQCSIAQLGHATAQGEGREP